MFSKK